MITLLSRLLIKNNTDYKNPDIRSKYGYLCGVVGIFLNVFLFAGKFIVGKITNSISITADAFNNLSDAGSSIITLLGFKLASQKPDRKHPFGHGRFEYLSGLFVSIAIVLMGFELMKTSIEKIINPEPVETGILSIVILMVSILIKLYMSLYNKKIGKKIDSPAMMATSTDSISDCISTVVVLVSSIISRFVSFPIDAWCGLIVSLFILFAGCRSAVETVGPLLGQPSSKEFVDQIEKIVMSHDGIIGMHDLIINDYGPGRCIVSLHAEVPANCDIMHMHDTIDNIEHDLQNDLHCSIAVIHMDPVDTEDEFTLNLKDKLIKIIEKIDPELHLHDFRTVSGPTHTNIIFDLVIPYNVEKSDDEIIQQITDEVRLINDNYYTVIDIDRSYVV